MAERKRSKDGSRDSDAFVQTENEPAQQGRAGGELAERVGTRDEEKRAREKPAGATRVTAEDERETGQGGPEDG